MKRTWLFRLVALTALAMAGTGVVAPARACTCPGVMPLPMLESSEAVFLGMAVAIELVPHTGGFSDKREVAPAAWWSDEEKLRAPSRSRRFFLRRVTFVVDAAWKGVAGESVTVLTNIGSAACGVEFALGGEYLVYTHDESTGEHWVSSCSPTSELPEAREYLEVLPPPAVDHAARRYRRDADPSDAEFPDTLVQQLFDPSGWCGVSWCEYSSAGEAGTEAAGSERRDPP